MLLLQDIKNELKKLLSLSEDAAPEKEVIDSIHAGIDFRGAKLWILVFAIFVASLGLNTNSTAVIIGAMLISPLMGPIIGMGLSVGMNDFETFKRSLRSLSVATIFSVATATVYWLITPFAETQSELLARTSPTIWDVFIALFGGLAGIIALTSRSQRTGNVIPGVAIATALMPPLCTVGFGLGTGQWLYALGAFYLFIINAIFISVATFLGVRLMHFHNKKFVDKKREKRVRQYISGIVFVTMIPAAFITYKMIGETVWQNKAINFVEKELNFEGTQLIKREFNYSDRQIEIVLIGKEITAADTTVANRRLADLGLEGTRLVIKQANSQTDLSELKGMLQGVEREAANTAQIMNDQKRQIRELEQQLAPHTALDAQLQPIANEMHALFPNVSSLSLNRSIVVALPDTLPHDTVITATLRTAKPLNADDHATLRNWLKMRLNADSVDIIVR